MITVYTNREKMIIGIGLATVFSVCAMVYVWHTHRAVTTQRPLRQADGFASSNAGPRTAIRAHE